MMRKLSEKNIGKKYPYLKKKEKRKKTGNRLSDEKWKSFFNSEILQTIYHGRDAMKEERKIDKSAPRIYILVQKRIQPPF